MGGRGLRAVLKNIESKRPRKRSRSRTPVKREREVAGNWGKEGGSSLESPEDVVQGLGIFIEILVSQCIKPLFKQPSPFYKKFTT